MSIEQKAIGAVFNAIQLRKHIAKLVRFDAEEYSGHFQSDPSDADYERYAIGHLRDCGFTEIDRSVVLEIVARAKGRI